MHVRLPSVRRPRTFFDVFGVVVLAIGVMATVLTIWHGTVVRIEMVAFMILVFGWAVWATNAILKRSVEEANRAPERGRNW